MFFSKNSTYIKEVKPNIRHDRQLKKIHKMSNSVDSLDKKDFMKYLFEYAFHGYQFSANLYSSFPRVRLYFQFPYKVNAKFYNVFFLRLVK